MTEPLDVGDVATVWAEFTDVNGLPANPTTVVCTIRKPDGAVSTPAVANPTVGRFESVITIDQHGKWYFRFTGTGAIIAAEEGIIIVRRSKVL